MPWNSSYNKIWGLDSGSRTGQARIHEVGIWGGGGGAGVIIKFRVLESLYCPWRFPCGTLRGLLVATSDYIL